MMFIFEKLGTIIDCDLRPSLHILPRKHPNSILSIDHLDSRDRISPILLMVDESRRVPCERAVDSVFGRDVVDV